MKLSPDLTINIGLRYDYLANPLNTLSYPALDINNTFAPINTYVKVNDDTTANSQFFPDIAVDSTSGNIAVSWYDCRLSASNTETQFFSTVSTEVALFPPPNPRAIVAVTVIFFRFVDTSSTCQTRW